MKLSIVAVWVTALGSLTALVVAIVVLRGDIAELRDRPGARVEDDVRAFQARLSCVERRLIDLEGSVARLEDDTARLTEELECRASQANSGTKGRQWPERRAIPAGGQSDVAPERSSLHSSDALAARGFSPESIAVLVPVLREWDQLSARLGNERERSPEQHKEMIAFQQELRRTCQQTLSEDELLVFRETFWNVWGPWTEIGEPRVAPPEAEPKESESEGREEKAERTGGS